MINAYAAFEEKQVLKSFEYDPGELGESQIEIEVAYCGICHSDISMIDNEWGISVYPLVPGHEVAGTVSQVGSKVTSLKIGDRAGLGWHSGYCNQCAACNTGDHHLCVTAEQTIVGRHGGFADKVRADANSVVKIPDGIDLAVAGPLFCGGVTVFNPLLQFGVRPTDKVAVIGIGGLGHLALQFLNAWGCEVTAFTSSDVKRREALDLGAHRTLNSGDPAVLEAAAGRFDLIISTVNVKLDWNLYLGALAPKGRLHFVGAALEPLDLNVFALIMQQRSVSGSPVGDPSIIEKMLEFTVLHDIKPVIEIFDMADVNKAIANLKAGDIHYRAVLSA
ncbi:uncharacterized zinc-type alcohol dehydrogenase-like protein [Nitrosomonas sp. Nm51]|uniref:NADPH-dependent aldehyde reductase Ahr n=1 Tax=Nitrosomonas sp. Nm51 TaxID=133720 RepID=UPI0008AF6F61|nr:NAD(P)-dependent alcohol dehydrogenase [Nitrosomonas sp. Nm51]SER37940.1 uncharacterized zinc-type alcohol dehydrogenase-like protein [Nitrosomonas sp. Nm51]